MSDPREASTQKKGPQSTRSSAAQPNNQEAPERPEALSPPKSNPMPRRFGAEAACMLYNTGRSHFSAPACGKSSAHNQHSVINALEGNALVSNK